LIHSAFSVQRWISFIRLQNNLTVLYNVLIDRSIAASRIYDRFQFERIGFFSVDPDSVHGKVSLLRYNLVTIGMRTTEDERDRRTSTNQSVRNCLMGLHFRPSNYNVRRLMKRLGESELCGVPKVTNEWINEWEMGDRRWMIEERERSCRCESR